MAVQPAANMAHRMRTNPRYQQNPPHGPPRRMQPYGRADQSSGRAPQSGNAPNRRPPLTSGAMQHQRVGDQPRTRTQQRTVQPGQPLHRPMHIGRGQGRPQQRMAPKPQPPKWSMASLLKEVKIGQRDGEPIMAKEQFVKVRKVESGDSIFIQTTNGEKAEKIILDGISAGKVTRGSDARNKEMQDDIFAWEAREHLRQLLIGELVIVSPKAAEPEETDDKRSKRTRRLPDFRRVRFRSKICHANSGMEHDIWKDVGEHMIENGWAKKKTKINEDDFEEGYLDRLEIVQQEAKEKALGCWERVPDFDGATSRKKNNQINPRQAFMKHHLRVCDWGPSTRQLYENFKGKPIPAIIDDVIAGSTVRLELLLYKEMPQKENTLETAMVVIDMSGLDCPRIPGRKGKKRDSDEDSDRVKLAREAQQFTYVRLCHRNVNVVFDWIDTANNLYATIEFPRGDIAQLLLSGGYAKILPWSLEVLVPEKKSQYKDCEQTARTKKRRIWKLEDDRDQYEEQSLEEVEVMEVVTGDQIRVKYVDEEGKEQERRVFLASIRAPRIPTRPKPNKTGKGAEGYKGDPYGLEAKEFVRASLIRKKIKIQKEYSRQTRSDTKSDWVTVFYLDEGTTKNMNVELCRRGLAHLAPHSRGERRATNYAELQQAREEAERKKNNIFSDEPYQRKVLVDFTSRVKKDEAVKVRTHVCQFCRDFLGFDPENSRRRRNRDEDEEEQEPFAPVPLRGIIEYIISGGRVKIYLPQHHTKITLVTSGIQVESKGDLGNEAREIMQEYRQQEVMVEVERVDRNNNFIGHIRYGSDMQNLSVPLLKKGLAKCQWNNLEGSAYKTDFKNAEQNAKGEKIGCWEGYEPPKRQPERVEGDDLKNEELDENGVPIAKPQRLRENYRERGDRGDRRDRDNNRGDRRDRDNNRGDRRDRDNHRGRGMGKGRGRGRSDRERRPRRTNPPRKMKVSVRHVESGTTFFATQQNSQDMKKIEAYLSKITPENAISEHFNPERTSIVAGLYEDDFGFGYHRVQIRSIKKKKTESDEETIYQVRYIDYGTHAQLSYGQILEITDPEIRGLRAQAVRCELAGLQPPPKTTDYYKQAENLMWNETSDKIFNMETLSTNKEDTLRQVVLYHDGQNLNDYIVQIGYARVKNNSKINPDFVKKIKGFQSEAMESHVGMWRYGDIGSDEED